MIDNYLLEELVAFKKYGTLAATAEHLMVTQPTVTRGMQKLEDELGVQIFNRQPNRISLTKTGELAATEAQGVLKANQQFYDNIRNFDLGHRVIKVASAVPGPLILFDTMKDLAKNVKVDKTLFSTDNVTQSLIENNYSIIITNQEFQTPAVESLYIGTEKLSVNLDKFMALASLNSVTFKQLKGLSFIVLTDIGVWKDIIQQEIPDAKFLYQAQRAAFSEITQYSNFPYFTTNISKVDRSLIENDDRIKVPISDKDASMDLYVTYLKEKKSQLNPLIKEIHNTWNKLQ
ncbi:LysR family transcriptional regulator [Companilactobacillus halodurans]|uniref:LysR family transcriptional regulator n=1 Tax=Companilactobacillus halodurans TaxID=2584183 RepID=A0A5P0ZXH3_9LACO|nr:LysR family transcriptional regulator [Companilactobacillus halodurans]MQS76196.1 LysR family transcriptional regulator [Companilactobacillus halodurans]MQS97424.1 LysR family transcriptional regulator [Companilactobacillus halodurans]